MLHRHGEAKTATSNHRQYGLGDIKELGGGGKGEVCVKGHPMRGQEGDLATTKAEYFITS